MQRILITGATGNVGIEVIRYLTQLNQGNATIIAGVRNVEKARALLKEYQNLEFTPFDFDQPETFANALKGINTVFLLRPPHISNVKKYFDPLIAEIKYQEIKQVVFLSVQGAPNSRVIPHHKIEKLIEKQDVPHIFLRPSYFMQNLTTTLWSDIANKKQIILPAGTSKFNWVGIENIAELAAVMMLNFEAHKNKAFDVTGYENLDFYNVANQITTLTNHHVKFTNLNPIRYYFIKRSEGLATGLILVMIMLHFLPRFQSEPVISDSYFEITHKEPTSLSSFILREMRF